MVRTGEIIYSSADVYVKYTKSRTASALFSIKASRLLSLDLCQLLLQLQVLRLDELILLFQFFLLGQFSIQFFDLLLLGLDDACGLVGQGIWILGRVNILRLFVVQVELRNVVPCLRSLLARRLGPH